MNIEQTCPYCGHISNLRPARDGVRTMSKGDIVLCTKCGEISEIDDFGLSQTVTPLRSYELAFADQTVLDTQYYIKMYEPNG